MFIDLLVSFHLEKQLSEYIIYKNELITMIIELRSTNYCDNNSYSKK